MKVRAHKSLGRLSYSITKDLINSSDIWDGAASLSFYILFAIFPGILVGIAYASLFSTQQLMQEATGLWSYYLPESIQTLIESVVEDISQSNAQLSILSIGFFFCLWTATSGVAAVIRQLNEILGIKESRSAFKIRIVSLVIAFAIGFSFVVSFFMLTAGKLFIGLLTNSLPYVWGLEMVLHLMRVLMSALAFLMAVCAIYFLGPDGRFRFYEMIPGAAFCSVVLLASSQVYSSYLDFAGHYTTTYGSLGAGIGLLMWLYIFSFVLLIGMKVNQNFIFRRSR